MPHKITITDEVLGGLKSWLKAHGENKSELARRVGVTSQAVGQWLNGETQSIGEANWPAVHREIAPFLADASKVPEPMRDKRERLLLKLYRALTDSDREDVLINVMERALPTS